MTNLLFREGVQIYLIEGYAFVAYFYVLVVLALVEFLTLFLPSMDPQMWKGPANLFKVSAATALIAVVYFVLRLANQEYVPWKFTPPRRCLRQGASPMEVLTGQSLLLFVLALLFILLCSPLLFWAGAISRAPVLTILATLFLLFFYACVYGAWGLASLALWEYRIENRQVFVRCLFIGLVFLSALVYLPANPIAFLLLYLDGSEMPRLLWNGKWSAPALHFLFHLALLASALLICARALTKEDRF